jgi:hypothetical protein
MDNNRDEFLFRNTGYGSYADGVEQVRYRAHFDLESGPKSAGRLPHMHNVAALD